MKINQPDAANAAIPEAFEALVVPDGLSERDAENARGHLDWVHGDARQFSIDLRDAEAASPADPRLVARARASAAQLLHSLEGLQAAHEVMVPAGFIDNWRRATDVRLRTLGATRGVVSSHEPQTFTLRPFLSKRFAIETMNVESLEAHAADMIGRLQHIMTNTWLILMCGLGGSVETLAQKLTQILYDEVQVRLEAESLDQRLDRCSSSPIQLRAYQALRTALVSLGLELSWSSPPASDHTGVKLSTYLERAWAVNNLILDEIETAPERVGSITSRDVTRAVQGDPEAWERLCIACLVNGGSQQPPETRGVAHDLRAQDQAIDGALERERQRQETFEAGIRAYVDAELPASDDEDEHEAMRATLDAIVRDRQAGRELRFFAPRGRFSLEEFRLEHARLVRRLAEVTVERNSYRARADGQWDWPSVNERMRSVEAKRADLMVSHQRLPLHKLAGEVAAMQSDRNAWRERAGGGGDAVEAPGWPVYDCSFRASGIAATKDVQLESGSAVRESGEDSTDAGSLGPATIHVRGSMSQPVLHSTGDSAQVLPTTHVGDDTAVIPCDDAVAVIGHATTSETAAETRKRLAGEDLRYKLAVANDALRPKRPGAGKPRATVAQLAKQIGWHPSYLSSRAKKLGVDLNPFKLLFGAPIFDRQMIIEKT